MKIITKKSKAFGLSCPANSLTGVVGMDCLTLVPPSKGSLQVADSEGCEGSAWGTWGVAQLPTKHMTSDRGLRRGCRYKITLSGLFLSLEQCLWPLSRMGSREQDRSGRKLGRGWGRVGPDSGEERDGREVLFSLTS